MKITEKWLNEKGACQDGKDWYVKNCPQDSIEGVEKLIEAGKIAWASWLIVRTMEYKQYVSYAVYAAEQVIDIYEKEYPNDKRPRQAIMSAKKCIDNPSVRNKEMAADAAAKASAKASAYSSYASDAAYAAAYAADAAYAAYAAFAADAADAAADAAVNVKIKKRLLEYGIKLLKGEGK